MVEKKEDLMHCMRRKSKHRKLSVWQWCDGCGGDGGGGYLFAQAMLSLRYGVCSIEWALRNCIKSNWKWWWWWWWRCTLPAIGTTVKQIKIWTGQYASLISTQCTSARAVSKRHKINTTNPPINSRWMWCALWQSTLRKQSSMDDFDFSSRFQATATTPHLNSGFLFMEQNRKSKNNNP